MSHFAPGVTVVLLPGLHGTTDLFDPILTELEGDLTCLVAAYSSRATALESCAAEVVEMIPKNCKIVIVAESFAGPLSSKLERISKQIKGVVVCASCLSSPIPSLGRFLIPKTVFRCLFSFLSVRVLAAFISIHAGLNTQAKAQLIRVIDSVPRTTLWSRLKSLANHRLEDLPKWMNDCPMLFLDAKDDIPFVVKDRELRGKLRRAKSVEIDGPHLLLQTRPKLCATEIVQFIKTLDEAQD